MNAFSKITSQLLGEDGEFEAQEIKARKSSNIILWSRSEEHTSELQSRI